LEKTNLLFSQSKRDENSYRLYNGQQEKTSMNGNEYRELRHDDKRSTVINLYKSLNETEFLSKTHSEIKQEFRKMPNPPAKDIHAAK
jgi:hypothetical protein